jgi:hexosaminidase
LKEVLNKELFTDLYTELASTHHSKYIHIGGDETYLLGHCPICAKKAAEEGISKLYIDHIKMLCDIIIKLGKRPILWADIALKYPESLSLLPKETIFIDWNYGWDMNRFGDHQKLLNSGFEIWGAPSIRSHPDNYFLTLWDRHAKNIRDFVGQARQMGYKGIILTSWSTSGEFDALHESSSDIFDLYAIRHVYPITGFNMLIAAYSESLRSPNPLDIKHFITGYCKETYGLNLYQADSFWLALTTAPYEVEQGKVIASASLSLENLMDSQINASAILAALAPQKNKDEFEQYRLMTAIRIQYLAYEQIENRVNSVLFSTIDLPEILTALKKLILNASMIDQRFINLNQYYFHLDELLAENHLRDLKPQRLYAQLSKQ